MTPSSPPEFDLTYRIERHDYRQMMHAYWSLTAFRRWRVRFLMAIPAAAALFAIFKFSESHDPYFLLLAAMAASAFIFAPMINDLSHDRVYRRLDLAGKSIRMLADPTGLSTTMTGKGESKTPWSAIAAVTARQDHVFLWLNPYNAIIVPRRAHPDAASADRFEARIHGWITASSS
jgi:hypothetical protein